VALGIILLWLFFLATRRIRYGSWPPLADHLMVVMGLFSIWGVLVQAIVFLITKPPAIELLSQTDLVFPSVITLIVVLVVVGPRVFQLYFPAEVHRKAESIPPQEEPRNTPGPSQEGAGPVN
jgi:hypothetical protein